MRSGAPGERRKPKALGTSDAEAGGRPTEVTTIGAYATAASRPAAVAEKPATRRAWSGAGVARTTSRARTSSPDVVRATTASPSRRSAATEVDSRTTSPRSSAIARGKPSIPPSKVQISRFRRPGPDFLLAKRLLRLRFSAPGFPFPRCRKTPPDARSAVVSIGNASAAPRSSGAVP